MKKLITIGIIVSFLLLAGCVEPEPNGNGNGNGDVVLGEKYYVAPYGDNANNGSVDNPWKTIQYAWTHTEPGDCVYVREGIYHEKILSYKQSKSGNETHWITYKAYPNEKVIIEETEYKYWRGTWQLTQQSYIHIDGFWFINGSGFGIMLSEDGGQIHDVRISNCHFENYSDSMIKINGAAGQIEDVLIEENTGYEICNSWFQLTGQEGISISNCDGFIVRNNTISNCYKQCIDAKSGSKNGKIYGNNIDNSFPPNPHDTRKYLGGGIYVDSYRDTADSIYIYKNNITGDKTGVTIGAEMGGTTSNIFIHLNYITTTGYGVIINDRGSDLPTTSIKNIYVRYNIFKNNYKYFWNKMPIWKCENIVVENNTVI